MSTFTFRVSPAEAGMPVRTLVKSKFHFSARLMTKIKAQDLLLVNGQRVPGWRIAQEGDWVVVEKPAEKSFFPPEDIAIQVIYEDEDLLLINKQAGITVHPTKGHPDHTIANGLMKYMQDQGESFKIRFINRLDMDTSGILVVGKNSHAQAELSRQMRQGLVKKKYLALCSGLIEKETFLIDKAIGRPQDGDVRRAVLAESEGGYPSQTEGRRLAYYWLPGSGKAFSLVELTLLTGRTHQIRVHMASCGHPLLGDALYGGDQSLIQDRQALHAFYFSCLHPVRQEKIERRCPLPEDLQKLLKGFAPYRIDGCI